MKLLLISVLYLLIVAIATSCTSSCSCNKTTSVVGYYWRDYVGQIPFDAVQGGTDQSGNPTYIGQVTTKKYESLPTTIYSSCFWETASAYDRRHKADKNIKILCSNEQEKLSWVATNIEETHLLTNCHLVVGGFKLEHVVNLGRVNHNGQIIAGKVFSYPRAHRGLWIPDNKKEARFLQYNILTYDCEKQFDIDARNE